ncbi:MAG TPA: HAMP domain-containing sensor histidine kinase [Edaphocola sp.]|nr:HAMP domain-containing sensor histidine kinase [Edaphocola sp.]
MKLVQFLYIFLLTYVIAALLFWGSSLNRQNKIIHNYELKNLRDSLDSVSQPMEYQLAFDQIQYKKSRVNNQYLGEGATFLFVILIGATIVYSSIRRTQLLSKQQHNFMLSITHELKSPIAAIKLNLETMERRKLSEDQKSLLMKRSLKETNRLNDLSNNLLWASQLENLKFAPAQDRINFSALVKETAEHYIERNTHSFLLNIEKETFISGDKILWKMLASNLIENACKYSEPDSLISVCVNEEEDQVIFKVADQGTGISDEEKQKIFKKFYRVGSEESRKTKGTGLGLFIIAQIVERHKASITVSDNQPKGSVFEVIINTA